MITRSIIAIIFGTVLYMFVIIATEYDGLPTIIIGPIVSVIAPVVTAIAINILFCFLLVNKVWPIWQRLWPLHISIFLLGFALVILSILPNNKDTVTDGDTGEVILVANQTYLFTGWLLTFISIQWNGFLGFSKTKKWV